MNDGAGCNLLLVEDDDGIGGMLERGLAQAGYKVDRVADLGAAIVEARRQTHQLVILDRMLPDGDGAKFCAALRKSGHPAAICMLTARDALSDKLEGFEAGADDYLTKPFEFEELLARLAVLRRRAEDRKPALRLEAETRMLIAGAQRVKLTKREWPLMNHLLRNEERAISREELMAEAWGADGAVTENSVDVYVGYLRRKLAKLDAAVRIETVRGEGFRIAR